MPQGHTGVEAVPHTFTTLVLKSCGSSASSLHCLTPGTHLTGSWLGPKASPDTMQNRKHLNLFSVQPAWIFYPGSKYRIHNSRIWRYLWSNIKKVWKEKWFSSVKGCRRQISNQVQEIKCRYTEYMRKQTLDTRTCRMGLVAINEQIINYRPGRTETSADQGKDGA